MQRMLHADRDDSASCGSSRMCRQGTDSRITILPSTSPAATQHGVLEAKGDECAARLQQAPRARQAPAAERVEDMIDTAFKGCLQHCIVGIRVEGWPARLRISWCFAAMSVP